MDKAKIKEGYNKIASQYASSRDQFKNLKYLEEFNKLLKPGSTILDLGCGSGKPIDKYFLGKGHKIIGLDISEEQIKLAKQYLPKGTFEVKDMDNLKENEYKVDAVVSFYAIFHIPRENHKALFQKINSFLPKGGYMLVTMGSSDWEGEEDFHGTPMQWSHYFSEINTKLVKDSGFSLILDTIDTSGDEKHQVIIAKKI